MKNRIFFVSCTDDYPCSASANNTKIGMLARGLSLHGDRVIIINKYYGGPGVAGTVGRKEGSAYISLPRKGSKLLTSWINLLAVCRILAAKKSTVCPNMVVIAGGSFVHHFLLCLFSKTIGIRTGMIFQEWHLSFDLGFVRNLNSYLFDKYLGRFVDVIFPISEYIISQCRAFGKPMLKIPIVADFDAGCRETTSGTVTPYFLYCASAGYFRIIRFILNSFRLLPEPEIAPVRLKMVLSGNTDAVRNEIEKLGLDGRVEIISNLPYGQLMKLYAGAAGLLIPLDPASLQDVARFSQKIAEYLSSCRPILTTAVGEIPHYFKEEVNAYIASEFTEEAYASLMQSVIEKPQMADAVGKAGCELGKSQFDYRYITKQMHDFISQ